MNENPYAAPTEFSLPGNEVPEDEQIRRNHLNAESNIKGVGLLYLIAAILSAVGIFTSSDTHRFASGSPEAIGYFIGTALIPLAFLALGYGLRKLSKVARIIAGILTLFGLLGFPVGTVVSLIILLILFSKKGRFVTTAEYKEIIAKTPHIKRKTSVIVWIFLVLLLVILGFGLVSVFLLQH